MKTTLPLPLIFLVILLLPAAPALSQVNCKTNISYSWRPQPADLSSEKKKSGTAAGAQSGEAEESPIEVQFGVLGATAQTEQEAKDKLQGLVAKEISRASALCSDTHENLSGCIGGKLTALSSQIQNLSFNARRDLEQSVVADCQLRRGLCMPPKSSDIICEAQAADTGEQEGKSKDNASKKKSKH